MLKPFSSLIDLSTGFLKDYDNKVERRLSNLKGMFSDNESFESMLASGDTLVYEVFEKKVPEESGQLAHAVTVIYPGKVGIEYFMTKGHFHVKEPTAELYLGIKGQGGIITQDKEGNSQYLDMSVGSLVYVSPYWAHRTVNTSDEPFSFLAVYPAEAGHDYGTIEKMGFPKLVVEQDGQTSLVDNPKFIKKTS